MAIDFTKPATTDNYSSAFVPNIQANQTALAQWLDSTQVSITGTPPTYAKRYNRASSAVEEYSGAAWAPIVFHGLTFSSGNIGIGLTPNFQLDVLGTVHNSGQFDNGGQHGITTGLVLGGAGSYYGRILETANDAWAIGKSGSRTGAVTNIISWTAAGSVLIDAPTSGTTFEAIGVAGGRSAKFTSAAAADVQVSFVAAGVQDWIQKVLTSSGAWQLYDATRGAVVASASTAGNIVFSAPTSGVTFEAIGVAGGRSAKFTSAAAADVQVSFVAAGVQDWIQKVLTASGAWQLYDATRGATVVTASATGNITFAAPSAGVGFTQSGFAGSDTAVLNGGTSGSFRVTDRGLPYGTSLHNNAGSVTGATNQYITSGTYTPSLTNGTNVAASTAYACQWLRVGNVVTVSGKVAIDPTLGSVTTSFTMSLPIASALTLQEQLGGVAVNCTASSQPNVWAISAGTAADVAAFDTVMNALTSNQDYAFHYTYVIL